MAVPKRRTSHSAQGHRRSHHHLGAGKSVVYCESCQEATQPHKVCAKCGYFRKREVIKMQPSEEQGN